MTDAAHNIASDPLHPPGGGWIVMATFNGGEFLAEQLASLVQQSWTNWRLLVRDDGSTDATRSLLEKARSQDPRIEILEDDGGRLGPARSFGRLLSAAAARGAEIVFCCDQDDVWHPEKISCLASVISLSHGLYGLHTPILAYSDARLVDRCGKPLGKTFARQVAVPVPMGADPLPPYLLGNRVPGCTLAVNRALLELAVPQPDDTPMHDWWLAALAAAAGKIFWIPEELVDYRQHGDNSVGAPGWTTRIRSAWSRWRAGDGRSAVLAAPGQACRLLERLQGRGLRGHETVIAEFLTALNAASVTARVECLCRWMHKVTQAGARFSLADRGKLAALAWCGEPRKQPSE